MDMMYHFGTTTQVHSKDSLFRPVLSHIDAAGIRCL